MLLSFTMVDFHLFYDGAVDLQIWALLTRIQCKVSDTQVTIKACVPLVLFKECNFPCKWICFCTRFHAVLFTNKEMYLILTSLSFIFQKTSWEREREKEREREREYMNWFFFHLFCFHLFSLKILSLCLYMNIFLIKDILIRN